MGIRIDGLDNFEKKLADIARRLPQERDRFLKAEAELMKGRAKLNTPAVSGMLRNAWNRTQPTGGQIEVYNNTEYAAHVEWGHRQKNRWVPGYWKGDRFVYDRGARTGMMLKDKFIDGSGMLHKAVDETKASIRTDARRILGGLLS